MTDTPPPDAPAAVEAPEDAGIISDEALAELVASGDAVPMPRWEAAPVREEKVIELRERVSRLRAPRPTEPNG